MSQKIALLTLSVAAAATLSANTFVTLAGTTASAGGDADGVAGTDAAIGALCPVDVLGTSTVIAGEGIVAGDRLEVGDAGTAVPQTTGVLVAIAVGAATAGALAEVLIVQGGAAPAAEEAPPAGQ